MNTASRSLVAQATGTDEKIGYALVYGVSGTYGDFPGQIIAQTGLTGTNFTSSNLAGNTYFVSGDYLLRNGLAKLRYAFSPSTSLTLTGYTATDWDDKTGNGDNDNVSYQKALYNAETSSNCTTTGGKPGIDVKEDSGHRLFDASAIRARSEWSGRRRPWRLPGVGQPRLSCAAPHDGG